MPIRLARAGLFLVGKHAQVTPFQRQRAAILVFGHSPGICRLGGGLGIGLILVAMSNGFIVPNATPMALKRYPHMAGSASAMLGLLTFIGCAIISPLVRVAGDHSAVPQSLVILVCSIVGVAAGTAVTRAPRPGAAGTIAVEASGGRIEAP